MNKNLLIIGIICVLVSCRHVEKQHEVAPIPVQVMSICKVADSVVRHYTGSLEAVQTVELTFPLGGTLTGVYVQNGQRVKRGQCLATIDDTQARAMYDAALATLRQAQDAADRMQKVYAEGGISEVRWIQMQTDLAKAEQTVVTTSKNLEDCRTCAPLDGVVELKKRAAGSDIRPGEGMITLHDISTLMVRFSVPEQTVTNIAVGSEIQLLIPALDTIITAVIREKAMVASSIGHTYSVRAQMPPLPNALPGMVVKVQMSDIRERGVVIPSRCVVTLTDGSIVWIVRDGVAVRQPVEVLGFERNGVLIKSGLDAGDLLITEGYQKLFPGAKVCINALP